MSITQLIDRILGASPSGIWSFANRTLTQKFASIERVAPSVNSSYVTVYRSKRVIKGGTTFVLATNSPNYDVVSSADDLASKNYTVVDTGIVNAANFFDHDDSTYAYSTSSIAATTEQTEVNINLGALYTGFIYLVYNNSISAYLYGRLYISSDGTTFTKVYDDGGAVSGYYAVLLFISSSFQYISYRIYNSYTSAITLNVNYKFLSLEFYPANLRNVLTFPNDTVDTVSVFSSNYYQLLEVLSI